MVDLILLQGTEHFFLIHRDIIGNVRKVIYEDKFSHDFDHKMVVLYMGKVQRISNPKIYNDTLCHELITCVGTSFIYDTLNNHCSHVDASLSRKIGNLVANLMEFYDFALEMDIDNIFWGIIDNIRDLSPFYWPDNLKQEAINEIDKVIEKYKKEMHFFIEK
jgi:hypothetical protein